MPRVNLEKMWFELMSETALCVCAEHSVTTGLNKAGGQSPRWYGPGLIVISTQHIKKRENRAISSSTPFCGNGFLHFENLHLNHLLLHLPKRWCDLALYYCISIWRSSRNPGPAHAHRGTTMRRIGRYRAHRSAMSGWHWIMFPSKQRFALYSARTNCTMITAE